MMKTLCFLLTETELISTKKTNYDLLYLISVGFRFLFLLFTFLHLAIVWNEFSVANASWHCLHTDKWWWCCFMMHLNGAKDSKKREGNRKKHLGNVHNMHCERRSNFVPNVSINSTLVLLMLIWKVHFRKCFSTKHNASISFMMKELLQIMEISFPIASMCILFPIDLCNSMAIIGIFFLVVFLCWTFCFGIKRISRQ